MSASFSSATTPMGVIGDRPPPIAPWPTITIITSGDTPARSAASIAGGARTAAVGTLPAPAAETATANTKNSGPRAAGAEPQSRSAARVTRPSVPLARATVKSIVTPRSVRNKSAGKKPATAFAENSTP